MTIVTYDFESGSNGATLDVGDEGGSITAVSSTKPTYATGAAYTSSTLGFTASSLRWAQWAAPAADFSGSIYLSCTANPGSGTARCISGRTAAAGQGPAIRFHSSGAISIVNAANSIVSTSAVTWTAGDDFRLDWQMDDTGADVAISLRIFKNANIDGTTPDDTISGTATGTDVAGIRVGNVDSGAFTFDFDNLSLSDVLEWIGPYVPAVTPLDTPVVTVTVEDSPSTPAATDGAITITWPAVTSADHYVAGIAGGHDVTSGFTIDDTNATSPHTFTGLAAGNYTVAVYAAAA